MPTRSPTTLPTSRTATPTTTRSTSSRRRRAAERRRPAQLPPVGQGAEQMSPDPVDEDDDVLDSPIDVADEPRSRTRRTGSDRRDRTRTSCRRTCSPRRARCSAARPSPTTWPGAARSASRRRTSTSETTRTRGRPPRALGAGMSSFAVAAPWSSASASSPWRSAPACSSRSTSCGSGTTSSRWCCRCWSSSAWWSVCAWCARPRTSAAR